MREIEGYIKFIHENEEYHFVTKRNDLNNNQMYSFDNWHCCYASNLQHVKSIIRDILKKAKILETTLKS